MKGWLRSIGVVDSEVTSQTLDSLAIGQYGGAPFCFSNVAELTVITRFLSLWIFHDDAMEGVGADPTSALEDALHGVPCLEPPSSIIRGWWEIGQATRERMSPSWHIRHVDRFVEWLRSVDTEARLLTDAHTYGPPTMEVYTAWRAINIGVLPTVDLIEYAAGRELDDLVLADPDRIEAETAACHIVAIQNDLVGLKKDGGVAWINMIASAENEYGTLTKALEAIADRHDEWVMRLARAGARLVARHGNEAHFWVDGLTKMVAGFAFWHLTAPRYGRIHNYATDIVEISLAPFDQSVFESTNIVVEPARSIALCEMSV